MFPGKRRPIVLLLATSLCFMMSCSAIKTIKLIKGGKPFLEDQADITIPFDLEGHLILVTGQMNNSPKQYNFIFDTAALTVIDEHVADEFQLEKGLQVKGKGSGGKAETIRLVKLRTIEIGKVSVTDCAAAVFDLSKLGDHIDAILGSNFLRHFRVTLDYRNRNIKFLRQTQHKDSTLTDLVRVPFKQDMKNGFAPKIKCLINDRLKIDGIIDTGHPDIASLPLSVMEQMDVFKRGRVLASKGSMSGGAFGWSDKNFLLRVNKLKIGDFDLFDFISVSNSTDAILIGKRFLSNFLVTLDYPKGEMILQPYSVADFEREMYSYGVALDKESKRTLCVGVWENSSADKNGIQPGDELISVNSQNASELSLIELMALFQDENVTELEVIFARDGRQNEMTLHKEMLEPTGE
jgi:hypothetical protein